MENSIINKEDTFENLLNSEYYFQSLLQILHSNNLLNAGEIENIQLQLINILSETTGYYTMDRSSSVKVETAEQIMLSIFYTIGLFLKSRPTVNESIELIKKKDVKYLFTEGEKILKAKVNECHRLFEIVKENKLKTENYAYIDTLEHGISPFFEQYDARFESQEAPCSIDYPLAVDEMNLIGVEYMENYLSKICLENMFCSYFDYREIECLLKGFNKSYKHMLINIFQIVLANCLGRILSGKGLDSLEITEGDRAYIKNILKGLSQIELQRLTAAASEKLCLELFIEDKKLCQYINRAACSIVPEIKRNIETDTLERVFITLNKPDSNILKYEDGKSLDDSCFRNVTEEIRDCSNSKDKIDIIRAEIHSLKDLTDVLSADCIFDEEFIGVFKALDDFEIALLIRSISVDEVLDTDYSTEGQREWCKKLKIYLEGLDEIKRKKIISMSQGIDI